METVHIRRDLWVDKFRIFNATAVKAVVVGSNRDIVLAKYKRNIPYIVNEYKLSNNMIKNQTKQHKP